MAVVESSQLPSAARQLGVEAVVSLCEAGQHIVASELGAAPLAAAIVPLLARLMVRAHGCADVVEWAAAHAQGGDADEGEEAEAELASAREAAHRLGEALGGEALAPALLRALAELGASAAASDGADGAGCLHAALTLLGWCAEACADQLAPTLPQLLAQLVGPGAAHAHPRVRWAALDALGLLCDTPLGLPLCDARAHGAQCVATVGGLLADAEPAVARHAARVLCGVCVAAGVDETGSVLDEAAARNAAELLAPAAAQLGARLLPLLAPGAPAGVAHAATDAAGLLGTAAGADALGEARGALLRALSERIHAPAGSARAAAIEAAGALSATSAALAATDGCALLGALPPLLAEAEARGADDLAELHAAAYAAAAHVARALGASIEPSVLGAALGRALSAAAAPVEVRVETLSEEEAAAAEEAEEGDEEGAGALGGWTSTVLKCGGGARALRPSAAPPPVCARAPSLSRGARAAPRLSRPRSAAALPSPLRRGAGVFKRVCVNEAGAEAKQAALCALHTLAEHTGAAFWPHAARAMAVLMADEEGCAPGCGLAGYKPLPAVRRDAAFGHAELNKAAAAALRAGAASAAEVCAMAEASARTLGAQLAREQDDGAACAQLYALKVRRARRPARSARAPRPRPRSRRAPPAPCCVRAQEIVLGAHGCGAHGVGLGAATLNGCVLEPARAVLRRSAVVRTLATTAKQLGAAAAAKAAGASASAAAAAGASAELLGAEAEGAGALDEGALGVLEEAAELVCALLRCHGLDGLACAEGVLLPALVSLLSADDAAVRADGGAARLRAVGACVVRALLEGCAPHHAALGAAPAPSGAGAAPRAAPLGAEHAASKYVHAALPALLAMAAPPERHAAAAHADAAAAALRALGAAAERGGKLLTNKACAQGAAAALGWLQRPGAFDRTCHAACSAATLALGSLLACRGRALPESGGALLEFGRALPQLRALEDVPCGARLLCALAEGEEAGRALAGALEAQGDALLPCLLAALARTLGACAADDAPLCARAGALAKRLAEGAGSERLAALAAAGALSAEQQQLLATAVAAAN